MSPRNRFLNFSMGWKRMPIQERVTLPWSISWRATSLTMFMGIANPMPAPPRALMPTTSPRRFTSGPPLFPGLINASIWIQVLNWPVFCSPSMFMTPSDRSRHEMMPKVTVRVSAKGDPMASTKSPSSIRSESPRTAQVMLLPVYFVRSSWITAMSVHGSPPISLAGISLLVGHDADAALGFSGHVVVGDHVALRAGDDPGAEPGPVHLAAAAEGFHDGLHPDQRR